MNSNNGTIFYYKSIRRINGKLKRIITDDNDNIVQNPTREQIELAIPDYRRREKNYNGMRCCICGSTDSKNFSKIPKWLTCICNRQDCKGFMCITCNSRYRNRLPDSLQNKLKGLRNCRTGNINLYSNQARCIIGEAFIVKTLGIDNLNIKMNNFRYYIDAIDNKYGRIDIKIKTLIPGKWWNFDLGTDRDYETNILVCMDQYYPWRSVQKIYIIPNIDIIDSLYIYITGFGQSIYDSYKVDPTIYNDMFCNLMEFLKYRRYFGIEDIKRWLDIDVENYVENYKMLY